MVAFSLLKMSGKLWYSLGMELRLMDASEIVVWAIVVTSERASWKTSVLSILQMQANVAALTRVIFGALSFKDSSGGSETRVVREVEACKPEDVGDALSMCRVVSNEILPNTQSINRL